jgi:hypothetical protein
MFSCYAPELRDCTVSCETSSDCARGQTCGDDKLCAAPQIAGTCTGQDVEASIDAGITSDVAATIDAAASIDAGFIDAPGPMTVSLRVRISGKGSVAIDGHGECTSEKPQDGDCLYEIVRNVQQRARAFSNEVGQQFVGWTAGPCIDQPVVCTFAATDATTIVAKFRRAESAD